MKHTSISSIKICSHNFYSLKYIYLVIAISAFLMLLSVCCQVGYATSKSEKPSHSSNNAKLTTTQINTSLPSEKKGSIVGKESIGDFLLGKTPSTNVLALGMWSLHFKAKPFSDSINWRNNLIGFNYKSFYIATFKNSFFNQSVTTGIRRILTSNNYNNIKIETGYNVGIIYGYKDGHGMFISKYSPIIPLVQGFVDITYYKVGIEISMIPFDLMTIGFKIDI